MGARTWMTIFRTSTRRSATLYPSPANAAEWTAYRISDEQVEFFDTFGYLAGIPMLTPEQVDVLRDDLTALTQPSHPGHRLFYEYNSNESADPSRVLFHALGAWRITPGFHDLLVEPGVSGPGVAAPARWRPFLARPVVFEARPSRRRGRLAPGLLLLDSHETDVAPDLLDRSR